MYEYHRELLVDKEKVLYDEILESYLQFRTEFATATKHIKVEELSETFKAVLLDHPEIFWAKAYSVRVFFGYVNTNKAIRLSYFFSESEAKKINSEIEEKLNNIVENATIYNTDEMKVRYVHDELIKIGTYKHYDPSQEGEYQSYVSIMTTGNTVCAGFAYSFKAIMDKLGIDSINIIDINNEDASKSHIWNIVKLDGEWLNIDITYDDELTKNDKEISSKYYLVKNDIFYKNHRIQSDVPTN